MRRALQRFWLDAKFERRKLGNIVTILCRLVVNAICRLGGLQPTLRCQLMMMASGSQTRKTCRICDKDLDPAGGGGGRYFL